MRYTKSELLLFTRAALLLLLPTFVAGQAARNSMSESVDWSSMTDKIGVALKEQLQVCNDERRWIVIVQTADLTEDGIPEALVEYCHMGAYTSETAVLQLEDGNPAPARFRDKNGKLIEPGFLRGASVRNGENTVLFPEHHAVYAIHWHTDDSGALESCSTDAYVWNSRTKTFDAEQKLSRELAKAKCRELKRQLECEASLCSK